MSFIGGTANLKKTHLKISEGFRTAKIPYSRIESVGTGLKGIRIETIGGKVYHLNPLLVRPGFRNALLKKMEEHI